MKQWSQDQAACIRFLDIGTAGDVSSPRGPTVQDHSRYIGTTHENIRMMFLPPGPAGGHPRGAIDELGATVTTRTTASGAVVQLATEIVRVDAWGEGVIRVRTGPELVDPATGALALVGSATAAGVAQDDDGVHVTSGSLTAHVRPDGRIWFTLDGRPLMGQPWYDHREPPMRPHRHYLDDDGGAYRVEASFEAFDGERLFGLGQHTLGRLDLKGCVIDLDQRNSQVSIPFLLSSRGYGFLWNTPSVGRVELAANRTRWYAERARQIDYLVMAGPSPAAVLRRYHATTGQPPTFPDWALGFWQSNSYYRSQDELLAVAREHTARGLPISAIFVDFMHWTHLGCWDWDPQNWPDPAAMVRELDELGIRLMVSVWPHVSPHSPHFGPLHERGLLVRRPDGSPAHFSFADRAHPDGLDVALLDLSHPDARAFLWDRVRAGYHDLGVRAFWLDACEPEVTAVGRREREHDLRLHLGPGDETASAFPLWDARAVREGLRAVGDDDAMILARSAWAGSQRYGVALWSGDIQSTWEQLRLQVTAGLNVMLSGVPWWTSDIGGFFDAHPDSDDFRELLVRWFQFAVFWPVVRLHGNRHPDFFGSGIFSAGGPNEVWSFGEDTYQILRGLLCFRERLRPYLSEQLELTARTGLPPVRPLWFDQPGDPHVADVEDQFLVGPDLLVAPVLHSGAVRRDVVLPRGSRWRDVADGQEYEGGRRVVVDAPRHVVPLFVRAGSSLTVGPDWFLPLAPDPAAGS